MGNRDVALASLHRALELDPDDRFRKLAQDDDDFASLRDDPEFVELVSAVAGQPDPVG